MNDSYKGAEFAEDLRGDKRCRFLLWRTWNPLVVKTCTFIMLNPSVADAEKDDPTIRKCKGFAKRWRYDRLLVVNLYPHISTDPRALDPTLRLVDNLRYVLEACRVSVRIVAAWGSKANPAYATDMLNALTADGARLVCLGKNKDGQPRHPLYLPYATEPAEFP